MMEITIRHEGKVFESYVATDAENCIGCAFFLGKDIYFGCELGGMDLCGVYDLKFREVK